MLPPWDPRVRTPAVTSNAALDPLVSHERHAATCDAAEPTVRIRYPNGYFGVVILEPSG